MKWNHVLLNSFLIIPTVDNCTTEANLNAVVKFSVKRHPSSSGKETDLHVLTSSMKCHLSLLTQTILTSNFGSILGVISNRKASVNKQMTNKAFSK